MQIKNVINIYHIACSIKAVSFKSCTLPSIKNLTSAEVEPDKNFMESIWWK